MLDGGAIALTVQPGVAVSRQLPESVRKRLRERLKGIADGGPGLIVRSAARESDDLEGIWRDLLGQWRAIEARFGEAPPRRLWSPPDAVTLLVRRFRPERMIAGDAATAAKLRSLSVAAEKVEQPFEALGIEDEQIGRAHV